MSATDIRRERMAQQEEQWKTTPGDETQWHADMEEKRKGRDGKSNRGKDRGKTQQWEEGREAAEESKGSA